MFDVVSIFNLKKTHDRDAETWADELSDASKSQILCVERWNTDVLFTSYLTHLFLKFVQVMTDFKSISKDFFLSWVKVESLLSFIQALWSWINHWLTWFSDLSSNASYKNDKSLLDESLLDTVEKDWFNMTAQDFLHLLKKLCIMILQNSIIYHQEFSAHFLWKDSLFVQDDYLTFANEVELSLLNVEKSNELYIRSIISDIVNRISITSENIVQSIQHHNSHNHQILKSLHDRMKNFFAEKFFITLHDSAAFLSDIINFSLSSCYNLRTRTTSTSTLLLLSCYHSLRTKLTWVWMIFRDWKLLRMKTFLMLKLLKLRHCWTLMSCLLSITYVKLWAWFQISNESKCLTETLLLSFKLWRQCMKLNNDFLNRKKSSSIEEKSSLTRYIDEHNQINSLMLSWKNWSSYKEDWKSVCMSCKADSTRRVDWVLSVNSTLYDKI